MTTIEDVAKKANTSIATVSRVLNNKKGFSEQTRERVLAVIEEIGYESNAIARSLKNQKTNTLGVIIPNVSSMLSSEILKGIEEYAMTHNYNVLVSYTYSEPDKVMKALKTFNEQRVDGIIFASDPVIDKYYDYMNRMQIPVVLVATESKKYPLPFIKVNDFEASYTAVNFLIDNGHTEIGMLAGNQNDPIAGTPRVKGYKKALNDAGLTSHKSMIISNNDFSFEDGQKAFEHLLKKHPEITAVFTASDEMAAGVIKKSHDLGITIPDEISVIGYDNIFLAQMIWPALTTVAQPLEKMGFEATKMLNKMMENQNIHNKKIYISHEVVERDSVKKIAGF